MGNCQGNNNIGGNIGTLTWHACSATREAGYRSSTAVLHRDGEHMHKHKYNLVTAKKTTCSYMQSHFFFAESDIGTVFLRSGITQSL